MEKEMFITLKIFISKPGTSAVLVYFIIGMKSPVLGVKEGLRDRFPHL